nr:S1 RNA-binding domain-containing protein [Verrucomicrobiota bacterium]
MSSPVICFGQQPCGFFPRRFLYAKFQTARRLQEEIGGEIVFFYHDSDHDPRETTTILHERHTGKLQRLNFTFANQIQKQFSPLYAKRVTPESKAKLVSQVSQCVPAPLA